MCIRDRAFIVLCDQLKLPGFIDVQRTSSHDVQPIGVLQAGLGVIKQGGIAVKMCIRDRDRLVLIVCLKSKPLLVIFFPARLSM